MGTPSMFATDEEKESRFVRRFKDNPMFPIGTAAFFGTVGYGLFNLRKRPSSMPLSMYIIHYRVVAQGLAISCFTASMTWMLGKKLYNRHWLGLNYDGTPRIKH